MHLHGAHGTEFLTAEATDALVAVNDRFFVFHGDGLGRADVRALGATDTLAGFELGTGGEELAQQVADQLAAGGE